MAPLGAARSASFLPEMTGAPCEQGRRVPPARASPPVAVSRCGRCWPRLPGADAHGSCSPACSRRTPDAHPVPQALSSSALSSCRNTGSAHFALPKLACLTCVLTRRGRFDRTRGDRSSSCPPGCLEHSGQHRIATARNTLVAAVVLRKLRPLSRPGAAAVLEHQQDRFGSRQTLFSP